MHAIQCESKQSTTNSFVMLTCKWYIRKYSSYRAKIRTARTIRNSFSNLNSAKKFKTPFAALDKFLSLPAQGSEDVMSHEQLLNPLDPLAM
jgi:hypothetical protein|tara:strand:+ start:575 stop:847 length:273 start_codon:yes stop_codon:yes gene_type:complete